jgi:hypothetical protein
MTKIRGNAADSAARIAQLEDKTAPGKPIITQAMATSKVYGPKTKLVAHDPTALQKPEGTVGVYIEWIYGEVGAKVQLINKSKTPTATFDDAEHVATLEPTGVDLANRLTSLWLNKQQVALLGLGAGDSIQLRLVDESGNASLPAQGRIEGSRYQQQGAVFNGGFEPASYVQVVDGHTPRKFTHFRHVADSRPPEVLAFEAGVTLKASKGSVWLRGTGLLESDARVEVFNCRTLARSSAWVGEKQELDLELPNVKNGDSLLVKVIDLNGVAAPEFELRYAAGCKDGRGPAAGLLAVRMPEVIKPT